MANEYDRTANNGKNSHITFEDVTIGPDTLHEISLRQPPLKLMRSIVRQAYLDENPSPTLVDAIISTLPDYHGSDDIHTPVVSRKVSYGDILMVTLPPLSPPDSIFSTDTFEVEEIDQIPGENEFMSGALLTGRWQPTVPMNDKMDCSTSLGDQVHHMPWRILDARSLVEIPELFQDPDSCFRILGEKFFITVVGLWRAYQEFLDTEPDGWDCDSLMLGALARRGGVIREDAKNHDVIYPEDMVSIVSEESDLYDEEYWTGLHKQGEIWDETFIDIDFWHGDERPDWAFDPVYLDM